MSRPQGRSIGEDHVDTIVEIVQTVDPTPERRGEESDCYVLVARLGNPFCIDPHRILKHCRADVVEVDDVQILRLVQLTGIGVDRLQHLGVLVVDHRLGGVDIAVEQSIHGEVLTNQLDILDAELGNGRGQFELVAEPPVPDLLPGPVLGRFDPGVGQRNLESARPFEHLGDVDDVGAALKGDQGLGHPSQTELGATGGEHLLGNYVDPALEYLDIETLIGVEAVVEGDVVPGELGLGEPLQLQGHLIYLIAILGNCSPVAVVTTSCQDHCQGCQPQDVTSPSGRLHLFLLIDVGREPYRGTHPGCAEWEKRSYLLVRNDTCQGMASRSAARITK